MIHEGQGGMVPGSPVAPLWTAHHEVCGWRTMHDTEAAAQAAETKHEEDEMKLVEQAWAQLDDQMDEMANLTQRISEALAPASDLVEARGRARGKAEILALFMAPHFTTADEIRDEAIRRWQARQSGDRTYQTKGLGSRRTEI